MQPAAHRQLVSLATHYGVRLVEPRHAPRNATQRAALRASCRAPRAVLDTCAITAANAATARAWMLVGRVDFVVLRVASPASFVQARWPASSRTRLIVVIPLSAKTTVGASWRDAIAAAGATVAIGLAAAPNALSGPGLDSYLSLVRGKQAAAAPAADTQAPTTPGNMVLLANSVDSLTVGWSSSTDDVGVAGYEVFVDGVSKGKAQANSFVATGLGCATVFTVGVEAYDQAGNHSPRATINATTLSGCVNAGGGGGGGSPGGPGPQPPSAPSPPPPPPPPASGSANLWVDVNGGSCVRSASGAAYSDAQACSWNQAYQASQTGDLILVKGGSYGNVSVGPNKASIAAPGVTFRTAAGESVVVNDFENGRFSGPAGGSNISFVGPVRAHTFRSDGTSNIVVDSWVVDCNGCDNVQMFHVENGDNVTVRNSDISDNQNDSLIYLDGSNYTFENNQIHDAGLPNGSSSHTECMYANDVTNLTLKRNHFYHCSVMDVFITGGSGTSNGGYVENNVFEKPWENTGVISNSALAFQFRTGGNPSPDPNNWDFRYNTFVGPLNITPSENPVGPAGMRVIGNVFLASDACGLSNTTYDYNAFLTGAGCGTHTIVNSLAGYLAGFTNPGDPGDYSLKAGSVLRDKGNPANFPAQDITGANRYTGNAPDLGAYEGP